MNDELNGGGDETIGPKKTNSGGEPHTKKPTKKSAKKTNPTHEQLLEAYKELNYTGEKTSEETNSEYEALSDAPTIINDPTIQRMASPQNTSPSTTSSRNRGEGKNPEQNLEGFEELKGLIEKNDKTGNPDLDTLAADLDNKMDALEKFLGATAVPVPSEPGLENQHDDGVEETKNKTNPEKNQDETQGNTSNNNNNNTTTKGRKM